MKIWKGLEMEGNEKGIMTLFVKDSHPCGEVVMKYLLESPECTRLYLGAGRTDVIGLFPEDSEDLAKQELLDLFDYCREEKIKVIVESSLENLENMPEIIFDDCGQVIVRIQDKRLLRLCDQDLIKLDDEKTVRICAREDMEFTSLKDLKDDLFTNTDVILFSNEEEPKCN